MTYTRDFRTVQNELQKAWMGVRASLAKMYPSGQVRPNDANEIFTADYTSGQLKFNAGPMVFRLRERASSRSADLFVVVSGWIEFAPPWVGDLRRTTHRFGTGVGYFRLKDDQLWHVYGVHYDMDEQLPGHPVFHAQMCSQAHMGAEVAAHFHVPFDETNDRALGLLGNVRTPTAQMDVFSVITQIGADHLVSEESAPEVHEGFAKLRSACDFFLGSGDRFTYLSNDLAAHCYRSTHWYERAGT